MQQMTTLRSTLNLGFDEFQPVEKEGFMTKKAMGQSKVGRSNKKKRWFELRGNVLKYYASEGPPRADPKAQLKGSLEVSSANVIPSVFFGGQAGFMSLFHSIRPVRSIQLVRGFKDWQSFSLTSIFCFAGGSSRR